MNTIKQEVIEAFRIFQLGGWSNGLHVPRTKSEYYSFLEETIDRVREATIQECVDALPKWKQLYMAPDGWNEYKDEARTTLLALKNKNIDV